MYDLASKSMSLSHISLITRFEDKEFVIIFGLNIDDLKNS